MTIRIKVEITLDENGELVFPEMCMFRLSKEVQSVFLAKYCKISIPSTFHFAILAKFVEDYKIETWFNPWSVERLALLNLPISTARFDELLAGLTNLRESSKMRWSRLSPEIISFQSQLLNLAKKFVRHPSQQARVEAYCAESGVDVCQDNNTPLVFINILNRTSYEILEKIIDRVVELVPTINSQECMMRKDALYVYTSGIMLDLEVQQKLIQFIELELGFRFAHQVTFSIPKVHRKFKSLDK